MDKVIKLIHERTGRETDQTNSRVREIKQRKQKVDVAALVLNAFEKQKVNLLTDREKRWGYLISLGLPPFG